VADLRKIALNPSTVLILSHPFNPSNEIGARRTTALARYLADNGIRVVVVSAFGDQPIEPGSELHPGVIAVPVKRPKRPWLDLLVRLKRMALARHRVSSAAGATVPAEPHDPSAQPASLHAALRDRYFQLLYFIDDYKKWSWRAAKAAIRVGREEHVEVILASGPPHSALIAAAWAARRLGIPYVADMRDPWSDVLVAAHPKRRIELRLLRALEGWVLRRAAAVTSTSASAAALLVERDARIANKVHVIRNGYDGEIAPPRVHTGGRLSILFAGLLYVRRTPYPLLAALETLLARPEIDAQRIQLTLMGDKLGDFSDQLLAGWLHGKRCASVVRTLPPQTSHAVAQEVAQATVLLNLAQQQPLQVPAKTYEQLATGREILVICEDDCETARVVSGITGVVQVDQSDPELLVRVLLDLYNRHVVAGSASVPAEADVRRFSRAFSNERFRAVLTSVAALPIPPERSPEVQQPTLASASGVSAQPRVPLSRTLHRFAGEWLADARFYRALTRANHSGPGSLVWTMLANRGLWLLMFHRVAHFCLRRRNRRSPVWWIARLCKSIGTCFSVLCCRSQLSEDCEIGAGAYLANQGHLLCGAHAIGAGSLIHARCTFGRLVDGRGEGRPSIGKNVWIGPNCIIAGELTVGDGATVLPNSVLTFSVPPGAVVKGNPARVVRTCFDNSALRRSLTIVSDVTTEKP
jgi:serine acetyltransferase/glycosyltransferase involved in cell wall biosynthesis